MIGREVSPETTSNQMREEQAWIGKPWRRVEVITRRYFCRGEECAVERDLQIHVGLRRFGLFATLTLSHADGFDYEDIPL